MPSRDEDAFHSADSSAHHWVQCGHLHELLHKLMTASTPQSRCRAPPEAALAVLLLWLKRAFGGCVICLCFDGSHVARLRYHRTSAWVPELLHTSEFKRGQESSSAGVPCVARS
eukprot:12279288-Alexandrium_andersonii.AAC.1